MKGVRVFAAAVCATLFCVAAAAQSPLATPFYTSNCIKVKPEKDSEFRKWARETLHKYAQARVDSGSLLTWFLMRAVVPQGSQNACDYVVVGVYADLPPKPLGEDELNNVLKKAGLGMTAEQYAHIRIELSELVQSGIFRTLANVGTMQKGDYALINLNKTNDVDKWIETEKKLWLPMAVQFVEQGITRGWYANARVVPAGSGMSFDVMTVDIYPSWDAYFQFQTNPKVMDIWKQVHPGQDINQAFSDFGKTVNRVAEELWVIDDLVTAGK